MAASIAQWYGDLLQGLTMDRKQHWEQVYQTKASTEVSWFLLEPMLSLRLLDAAGLDAGS